MNNMKRHREIIARRGDAAELRDLRCWRWRRTRPRSQPPRPVPRLPISRPLRELPRAGYVAASYYHSNGYNTYHQFDNKHDTFQLDQAALTVAYQPKEGFGALVDVAAGEDMKILNAAEGSNPNTFDVCRDSCSMPRGPITVIAGKYVTLAGAEVIAPTGNTNFSRSFLFYAEPLTHTGIRATYAVSDTLTLSAGVNNGWNYSSLSTSGSKTAEVGVAWTPSKTFSLTAQAYVGKDPTLRCAKNPGRCRRDLQRYRRADVHFELRLGQAGTAPARAIPSSTWNGAAFYTNYAINDQWRVSLRIEYLDDKNGFVTGHRGGAEAERRHADLRL